MLFVFKLQEEKIDFVVKLLNVKILVCVSLFLFFSVILKSNRNCRKMFVRCKKNVKVVNGKLKMSLLFDCSA